MVTYAAQLSCSGAGDVGEIVSKKGPITSLEIVINSLQRSQDSAPPTLLFIYIFFLCFSIQINPTTQTESTALNSISFIFNCFTLPCCSWKTKTQITAAQSSSRIHHFSHLFLKLHVEILSLSEYSVILTVCSAFLPVVPERGIPPLWLCTDYKAHWWYIWFWAILVKLTHSHTFSNIIVSSLFVRSASRFVMLIKIYHHIIKNNILHNLVPSQMMHT